MFAGSHRGGELAAIAYNLIASCKIQKINPAKWLEDVLHRLPNQPKDNLLELVPQCWKPAFNKKPQSACM
ncbi:transposase domain-containing protein [Flavitalea flava]